MMIQANHIGNFWSYNGSPCTGTPPRLYNIIARQIATAKGNKLRDNALLLTMINVGLANAGITAWDSKYHYAMWRPIFWAFGNTPTQTCAMMHGSFAAQSH